MRQNNEDFTGLILCGGKGTRLFPNTLALNKHLLPVYSKPMVYYPLSMMLMMGLKRIILVTDESDLSNFQELLGWITKLPSGIDLQFRYATQSGSKGIVDAISSGLKHVETLRTIVILGDNIFYGAKLIDEINIPDTSEVKACAFSCNVDRPERFGVVVRNNLGKPEELIEKPESGISNEALTGMYAFETDFLKHNISEVTFSSRGELEIVDLLRFALDENSFSVDPLPRGVFWLDAGTLGDFHLANEFVRLNEKRTGQLIGCPEEVLYRKDFITKAQLGEIISSYPDGRYKSYLKNLSNL